MAKRVRVEGIRKSEISAEDLSLMFWLQAKRLLREKREREAKAKAKRRKQRGNRDER